MSHHQFFCRRSRLAMKPHSFFFTFLPFQLEHENALIRERERELVGITQDQKRLQQDMVSMIRTLKHDYTIMKAQVSFERGLRQQPPAETPEQARLRLKYEAQRQQMERFHSDPAHVVAASRRRQKRAWEQRIARAQERASGPRQAHSDATPTRFPGAASVAGCSGRDLLMQAASTEAALQQIVSETGSILDL